MTPAVRLEALAHAAREYPREACGLVVRQHDGLLRYRRCVNLSEYDDRFEMAPSDYAAAERDGEIVAVFHSHPDMPALPSDADRSACTETGVTWHIVSIPEGVWATIEPEAF